MWLDRLARLFAGPDPREECRCRNPFGEVGEGAELVLDARGLSLEGQTGRTLERMEVLPPEKRLRHINTLIPWPLLAMIETRGYRYRLVGRVAPRRGHALIRCASGGEPQRPRA